MRLMSLEELGRSLLPGDRVMIVSEKRDGNRYNRWNDQGGMDHHLATVMTVRKVIDDFSGFRAKMTEDRHEHIGDGWSWYPEMIAGVFVEDELLDDDTSLWETQSLTSLLM